MEKKEDKQTPSIETVELVGSTKWLHLKTVHYEDSKGAKRKWDMASRATKHSMDEADAVAIVPILRSSKNKQLETILVQQYRPPIGQDTLEFPAGLIDKGETAEQAAIRELHEETGFVGTVNQLYQSMVLCMSPGICDETIKMIVLDVDLDDEVNLDPQQILDDGEDIIMIRIDLFSGLKQMMESGSCMPISLLYSFALGIELGQKYK